MSSPIGTEISVAVSVTMSVPMIAWTTPPEVMSPNTPTMSVVRNSADNRPIPREPTVHSRETSGISARANANVTSVVASLSAERRGPSSVRDSTVSTTRCTSAPNATTETIVGVPVTSRTRKATATEPAATPHGAQRGSERYPPELSRAAVVGSFVSMAVISWLPRTRRGAR